MLQMIVTVPDLLEFQENFLQADCLKDDVFQKSATENDKSLFCGRSETPAKKTWLNTMDIFMLYLCAWFQKQTTCLR